jgi:hypothetical protein
VEQLAGGRKVSDSGKTSEIRFGLAREKQLWSEGQFHSWVDGACGAVPVNEHNTYPDRNNKIKSRPVMRNIK